MPAFRSLARALVVGAGISLVPLTAVPAMATGASPASGSGSSSLTLLSLVSGSTSAALGQVSFATTTVTAPASSITVVPLDSSVTGAVGKVVVTPANSPQTVGGKSVSLAVGTVTGPALQVAATVTNGLPLATAVADALGSATVLGVPINLGVAHLNATSSVTSTEAFAGKTLTVNNVALPSIEALLAALHLNLSALDTSQLSALVGVLGSTVSSTTATAIATAKSTISAAQSALGSAGAAANTLAAATSLQATETSAFDSALNAIPVATLVPLGVTVPTGSSLSAIWSTLSSTVQAAIEAANPAVAAAQTLLTAAGNLVTGITDLLSAVTAALSANPLASLSGLQLATAATAARVPTAAASATVGTLDVLGAPAAGVSAFTGAFNTVTGQLASVLNGIAGVNFTPPAITLGQVTRSTSVHNGVSTATAAVSALTIRMPTITLPAALAIPGAPSVPYLTAVGTVLTSQPAVLAIGLLSDTATYHPAVAAPAAPATAATPAAPAAPSLPNTGLSIWLPVTALVLVLGGLAGRRRRAGYHD